MDDDTVRSIVTSCKDGHDNEIGFETKDFISWCNTVLNIHLPIEAANNVLKPHYRTPYVFDNSKNLEWYFENETDL